MAKSPVPNVRDALIHKPQGRLLPKKAQGAPELSGRIRRLERRRRGLLAELLAGRVYRDRKVGVAGRRVAQQALQEDLPWRGSEQIGAPDHVGNTLLEIVHR